MGKTVNLFLQYQKESEEKYDKREVGERNGIGRKTKEGT